METEVILSLFAHPLFPKSIIFPHPLPPILIYQFITSLLASPIWAMNLKREKEPFAKDPLVSTQPCRGH